MPDTFTMMGIYPVGGKFDDGTLPPNGGLNTSTGTGAAPCRLLTYADRLYLEAELVAVGKAGVDTDLKTVTMKAVEASLAQVDQVVAAVAPDQTVPDLVGSGDDEAYLTAVEEDFDAASSSKKLEIIMTQKWISSFGTSHDQYTDYRRTGYPVLFDPENPAMAPGGFVSGGPDGTGPVPVQRNRDFPLSWPWSSDELSLNENAPDQKTITTYNIFWDK